MKLTYCKITSLFLYFLPFKIALFMKSQISGKNSLILKSSESKAGIHKYSNFVGKTGFNPKAIVKICVIPCEFKNLKEEASSASPRKRFSNIWDIRIKKEKVL